MFKKCGQQWAYRYLHRVPDPQPKPPAAERGTSIHDLWEQLLKGEIDEFPDEFDGLKMYNEFALMLREKGAMPEVEFRLNESWEPVESGGYVRGFIDILVLPGPPTMYIYELKTGREYDDHVFQRQFYGTAALAIKEDYETVKVTGVYLDQGRNVENEYHSKMLTTYKYFWDSKFELMEKESTHVPNPGPHCRWCPYSNDKGGPCKFSGN
jgi:CRISPR/Cas system-associated exonuclease Cas4 (RecB family)